MSDISRRATTPDLSSLLGPDFDALFNSVKKTMPGATTHQPTADEPLPPIAAPLTVTAEASPATEPSSQPEPIITESVVQEIIAPEEAATTPPTEERTVMDLMPDLSALVNEEDSYSKPTVSDVINLQTMATAQDSGSSMALNNLFENTGVEDLPPEEEVDMPLVPAEASSATAEDSAPVDLSTLEDEPEVILNASSPIVQAAVMSTIEQDNITENEQVAPIIDENNLLAEEPSGTGYDPLSELAEAAAAEASELPAFANQPAEITPPPAVAEIADEADNATDRDQQSAAEAITTIPETAAVTRATAELNTANNTVSDKGSSPLGPFITKQNNALYGLLAATIFLALTTLIFGLLFIKASSTKAELKGQLQVLTAPKAFTGCQRLTADDNHANCIFRANYQLTRCVEVCSVSKYRQACEDSCHDSAKNCEKNCPVEDKQELPQVLVIKTTAEPQSAPADAVTDYQPAPPVKEVVEADTSKNEESTTVSSEPEKPKVKTPTKKSPAKKNTKKPTSKKRK